ncbi:hypothetical protein Tco_0803380 [Tanacetum coccineum]|uniref:Uncharacterized protein n=1 Tax=Tanacetum coccineum TaxID=301880 RepID=A0ABQ5A546_9ASTR
MTQSQLEHKYNLILERIRGHATKDSLKRFGEELQTKTSKRLKSDEAKEDEPTKKTGKRKKQIARKGLHSDKADEDEYEDSKDDDPISDGTDIVYTNFGAMLKDITRDDLTELYRIVMNRYGVNGLEVELEKEQTALGKDFSNPLMADNLPKIVWLSTHHICFNDSPLTRVNTPGSDENSLKLYDLIADMKVAERGLKND